jgi:hypothetical protein
VFVRWRSVPAALGVHAAGNWTRDLLLSDPATVQTFVSPFSVRQWMPLEQFTARVVWNAIVVARLRGDGDVVCAAPRAREAHGAGCRLGLKREAGKDFVVALQRRRADDGFHGAPCPAAPAFSACRTITSRLVLFLEVMIAKRFPSGDTS